MPAHPTLVGNPWLSRENGLNDFDIIKLSQKYNYNNKVMAVITGRIAALRQTAGIKFTRRPKIRFFAPQGRFFAPIQVKLGRADGHVGPLGCAKFLLNRQRGVELRPPNDSLDGF